jgi:hypothetical protein
MCRTKLGLVPLGKKIRSILQSRGAERGVRQKGKVACHFPSVGFSLRTPLKGVADALFF